MHEAASSAAGLPSMRGPDAGDNLLHYLENIGSHQTVDVDRMLRDLPEFKGPVASNFRRIAGQARRVALSHGASEPLTYPVSTPWNSDVSASSNKNWFSATGPTGAGRSPPRFSA